MTGREHLDVRQQMVVAIRQLASEGYDDKLAGHLSVRDREDGSILVPRVGSLWEEFTVEDVVRIDQDGHLVEGEGQLNPTIVFHQELHRARPDIVCAIHNHPPFGTLWACAGELPPLLDQTGANGGGQASIYAEYGGVVDTRSAAAELADAYGDADMAILVGHGTLITASSVALALLRAQSFEHRCRKAFEVRTMGLPGVPVPESHADRLARSAEVYAEMLLTAYARRLRRSDPGALAV